MVKMEFSSKNSKLWTWSTSAQPKHESLLETRVPIGSTRGHWMYDHSTSACVFHERSIIPWVLVHSSAQQIQGHTIIPGVPIHFSIAQIHERPFHEGTFHKKDLYMHVEFYTDLLWNIDSTVKPLLSVFGPTHVSHAHARATWARPQGT